MSDPIKPGIHDMPEAERKWLEWRKEGIGASDIAAICGQSPFASPWSVWATKVGLADDVNPTHAMRRGKYAERVIGQFFTEDTGLHLRRFQEQAEHPSNRVLRATLDGVAYESENSYEPLCIVEMKDTTASAKQWEEEIPLEYRFQGAYQSMVTGIEHVKFAVVHTGWGFRFAVYDYTPSASDIEFVKRHAVDFWTAHVITGNPPEADAMSATTTAINGAWTDDDLDDILFADGDAELLGLVAAAIDAKAMEKQAKERAVAATNALKSRMGECTVLQANGIALATWKPQARRTIDPKSLREVHPDIADEHTRTNTVRALILPKQKDAA